MGGGRPPWLWNSAEGNREPGNGSKIGADAVAWTGWEGGRSLEGGIRDESGAGECVSP